MNKNIIESRWQQGIWTGKDGIPVHVRDMDTQRFINLCSWLAKWAKNTYSSEISAAYSVSGMLQGDIAQFQCDQDIERMENDDPSDVLASHPIFEHCWERVEEKKELPKEVFGFWEIASYSEYRGIE